MGFSHHEIGFKVSRAGPLLHNPGSLFDAHASGKNFPGVVIVASPAPSPVMFEVLVELSGDGVFVGLPPTDPLVDRLMTYSVYALNFPASADQFRAEFFLFQPLSGLLLQVFGKPAMFAFIAVAVDGFSLSRLRAILVGIATTGGDITGQLTRNSRLVNADNFSDFSV